MSQIGALFGGLFGDAGENFANEQGGADKVFGSKPQVADFVPVDLSDETGKAISANDTNYQGITDFLNKIIPGFSDMLTSGTSDALSELNGQLPQDVIDQVQRSSAYQSLAGGYSGTPMASALTARDLGLSSLNLIQSGQNAAQAWTQIAQNAYSPFTVSTSEQAATTAANNAGIQANQQYKYNVAASPDPAAAGVFNVDAALGQQMLSIGGSFLGGMFGGGTNSSGGATAAVAPMGSNTSMGSMYSFNPSTGTFAPTPASSPTDWRLNATGAWSDVRLKDRIVYLRTTRKGHRVYRFHYKGGKTTFEGVLAHEVQKITPEAVRNEDGYWKVDYSKIDAEFKMLKEAA